VNSAPSLSPPNRRTRFRPRRFSTNCLAALSLAALCGATGAATPESAPTLELQAKDVIALVGGANVVSDRDHGYLEVLLNASLPERELRVRNLGWEGDTVYAQPRELNFGSWKDQFTKAGATVVVAQFGQMESLQGEGVLPQFVIAYESLLDDFSRHTTRIVLVSPLPFEKASPPLPDLSLRNPAVSAYTEATRQLAKRRGWLFIDLHGAARQADPSAGRTSDGIHFNHTGHWVVANEIARQLAPGRLRAPLLFFNPAAGALTPAPAEQLRQTILARNQLWFDYWRPMNWAFLAGDRTEQPSSRDHLDPKRRWFPVEMAEFIPLIEAREREIAAQTAALARETR